MSKYSTTTLTLDILTLYTQLSNKIIDVCPIYQRNIVWDTKKKQDFIESCKLGIVPNPIIFNVDIEQNTMICIDGKQRLTSIKEYIDNKFTFNGILFCEEDKLTQNEFTRSSIPVIKYNDLSYQDQINVFHRLQNGIAMSSGEILVSFIKDITKSELLIKFCDTKKEAFSNVISNDRMQYFNYIIIILYNITNKVLTDPSNKEKELFLNSMSVRVFDELLSEYSRFFDVTLKVLNDPRINKQLNKNLILVIFKFIDDLDKKHRSANKKIIISSINSTYNWTKQQDDIKSKLTDTVMRKIYDKLNDTYDRKLNTLN
jgi:hypothetical protein